MQQTDNMILYNYSAALPLNTGAAIKKFYLNST